jgi:hypothetical protein
MKKRLFLILTGVSVILFGFGYGIVSAEDTTLAGTMEEHEDFLDQQKKESEEFKDQQLEENREFRKQQIEENIGFRKSIEDSDMTPIERQKAISDHRLKQTQETIGHRKTQRDENIQHREEQTQEFREYIKGHMGDKDIDSLARERREYRKEAIRDWNREKFKNSWPRSHGMRGNIGGWQGHRRR